MWPPIDTAKAEGHAELLRNQSPEDEKLANGQSKLTRLEYDILWRLSIGDAKPGISEDLNLSVRTIDMLIESATQKLDATSPIHAVSILLRNGDLGVTRYR